MPNTTESLDRWQRRLKLAQEAVSKHGATVDLAWHSDPPAPEALSTAAEDAGRPLPPALLELVAGGALRGSWHLENPVSLPHRTREATWGGLNLSVEEVVIAEKARLVWVEKCFPNRSDEYDVVWHDKFAFHTVPNGDVLAIGDGDGAVYYLSHDSGEGHGVLLGPSIFEFLDRWSQLGFVGPEDWVLLPFLDESRTGLDPLGSAAREWRAVLGIGAD